MSVASAQAILRLRSACAAVGAQLDLDIEPFPPHATFSIHLPPGRHFAASNASWLTGCTRTLAPRWVVSECEWLVANIAQGTCDCADPDCPCRDGCGGEEGP